MRLNTIDAADLAECAKKAAANWQKFGSFCWFERPDDAENWCIVYTSNRDSGLLDQSNAAAIDKTLLPFIKAGTVRPESHGHWAVGHVDGYAIKVYTAKGKITKAFQRWCEIKDRMDDYPVLDEEDYSRREYEATCENIKYEASGLVSKWIKDDWVGEVYSWLSDHKPGSVENRDDQGGYPSKEDIEEALIELEIITPEPPEPPSDWQQWHISEFGF